MSFCWERLPPMTRVVDWNRLAPNGPTGSLREAGIQKMLPNGFKTYTLQQEDELTAAQRERIVAMEPMKTDTAASSRCIEDMPLHMEVTNVEKIATKYDQDIIDLEKAINILADEIREMEKNEAEAFRKDVPDVDKEEDTKACKVENDGNKKTKKKRKKKKKKANKKGCKTEKEGNLKMKLDADCRKANVYISDVNKKEEKELDENTRKLVADALHAAVKLEAKLIVAHVVMNAVKIAQADHELKMMSAHASVKIDNAIKGAVNAMKTEQKKNEMDATAKEIANDVIRAAVNEMKDEKEKHEMDVRAKIIVNAALKGAVNVMQIEMKKNEMDDMAKGIVDSAFKGAVKVMQIEKEKKEMDARAKGIVDAALKGAVNAMQIEKEKNEMDARAKEIVDAALKGAVNIIQIEKEKNEMDAKAKEIVDAAIKSAVKVIKAEHAKAELDARAQEIVDAAIKVAVKVTNAERAREIVGTTVKGAVKKEVTHISKIQRKVGAAIKVDDVATETDAGVDNGNVLGAMLGQNGYDHRRIHIQVAPEKFTEKERTDICQYWSEKLGIATTKNTKLHRDVTYFGRM